jgi:hypothetical protein
MVRLVITLAGVVVFALLAARYFRSWDDAKEPEGTHSGPDRIAGDFRSHPVTDIAIQEREMPSGSSEPAGRVDSLGDWLSDLPAAARWAEALESEARRQDAIHRVAATWAAANLEEALAWADQLADPSLKTTALGAICSALIKSEPALAMDLARKHGLFEKELEHAQNLVREWSSSDFSAALRWASSQPGHEQRDQILSRLILVRASSEPVEAARLVAEEISPGLLQETTAVAVVQEWALRDLKGARDWVELFPDGPAREKATERIQTIAEFQRIQMAVSAAAE